jgi:hypothetical protein
LVPQDLLEEVRRAKIVITNTHHKRTRAGPRAGDASHRGCGAYDKPYPNERLAVT